MGRKFFAILGLLLIVVGLYSFSKDGSWAGLATGVIVLSITAYLKDDEI